MSRPLVRLVLAIALALAALSLLLPSLGLAAAIQLLVNPGLNDPFNPIDRTFGSSPQTLADGWQYYYVPENTYKGSTGASKLYWMSSHQFASDVTHGLDYFREGNAAQVIWSSYEFDAGIYQQVAGLSAGQDYAFELGMASYWRGSGYPKTDGKIKKCVGIDPYGGTSPTSTNVIWDWDNCDSTDKTWPYVEMAATAQTPTMTVFIRIQAPDNESPNHTDLDYIFIDDGRMTLAPTVTLTLPPVVSTTAVSFSWAAAAASGWSLQGVEVQYRDEADGIWHVVQDKTHTSLSSYTFTGQGGHVYTVRARPWEKHVETSGTYDLPGLWVEKQTQVTGVFAGYVRNNFGLGIGGATVTLEGTGHSTTSQPGGSYSLQPPGYGQVYSLTASAGGYGAPLPISAMVADPNSLALVTFTLKPPYDAILNGDFETGTGGWTMEAEGAGSAALFGGDGRRSGDASLELTGPITLSQVVAHLHDVYNPNVAFWYKPGSGQLEVRLEGDTASAARVLGGGTDDWQFAWLDLRLREVYSGPITVSFRLAGGTAYLDEVSLGSGPRRSHLPIIFSH
jgi:hypothetical protein